MVDKIHSFLNHDEVSCEPRWFNRMSRREFNILLHYLDPRYNIIVRHFQQHHSIIYNEHHADIIWYENWYPDITVLPDHSLIPASVTDAPNPDNNTPTLMF